jgi:asparagine synthetase B (glutamine-hydrolysing)
MSDFIYSDRPMKAGILSDEMTRWDVVSLSSSAPAGFLEFHGTWGSLAVRKNHYRGYDPIETDAYVAVVVGGPLLRLPRATQLDGNTLPSAKTAAMLHSWKVQQELVWDQNVSGPFAVLVIDKTAGTAEVVTDILGFVSAYWTRRGTGEKCFVVGTHVDVVAAVGDRLEALDNDSIWDFILNGAYTFPYSLYDGVQQLAPASISVFAPTLVAPRQEHYWVPYEKRQFTTIDEAAEEARSALQSYIDSVCATTTNAAVLLSGGEDARSVLAMLPTDLRKVCFTFADSYNREARIAETLAKRVGAEWHLGQRPTDHYARQFDRGCGLIGSQQAIIELHSASFCESLRLDEYDAVFGGLYSDSLLKGCYLPTNDWVYRGVKYWPSTIRSLAAGEAMSFAKYGGRLAFMRDSITESLRARLTARLAQLQHIRPNTATEWCNLWPITACGDPVLAARRLYRAFEPFTEVRIAKVAATVPGEWKINRRLFHRIVRPVLGGLGWVPHSNAHLPALPFWPNVPAALAVGLVREAKRLLRIEDRNVNQYSWPEWKKVARTPCFREIVRQLKGAFDPFAHMFCADYETLFSLDGLSPGQQFRLLQLMWVIRQRSRQE